ncbi:aminoglycoside phosphotransferase family protein [Actinomyces howellii]|uniref:Phosphotransferase enzyme family n=1 Tax=Actinomyces howellii TaxID=52771 RepID=A0A448HDN4_9ACTO|nr:aminoglycoside phosphotransferase family protein [Actinomyces howellii]VEG25626.1 Phosphotransferase enzyme family [Actinomyces howellii]
MTARSVSAAVETLLDPTALSELVDQPVRAGRLRIKPGVSVAVSLLRRGDGAPAGWARLLWPVSRTKAESSRRRAERLGLSTAQRLLPDGLLVEHGPIPADPRLGAVIDRAHRHGVLEGWEPEAVLRHNPLRRLVVAYGDRVVKLSAAPRPHDRELHLLVQRRLAVPEDLGVPTDREAPALGDHVRVLRRVGDSDLATRPDEVASRAAGGLLAALHSVDARQVPVDLRRHLEAPAPGPDDLVSVHARLLESLDTGLARRLRALHPLLGPDPARGPRVLIHGDASPDQVLVDRRGQRVWWTDFDRARFGSPVADLGSYLAEAGSLEGEALLTGYVACGGRSPEPPQLRQAVAVSRLARLVDPLRGGDPAWRERVGQRLDDLADVLEGAGPWRH